MNNLKFSGQFKDAHTRTFYRFYAHKRMSDDEMHLSLKKQSLHRPTGTVIEDGFQYRVIKIEAADGWEDAN